MSGLRDRIRRLKGHAAESAQADQSAGGERAGDGMQGAGAPDETGEPAGAQEALPSASRFIDTADGRFILRERVYPCGHAHGHYRLGELAGLHDRLTRISRKFAGLRPVESHRQLLFFDTETSGLGVGAGNVPFMLGIGFYTEDAFVVQQLFVRNPGEEQAMLHYFAGLCARFTHLVTYNGRTFDWPIVQNRYVLNRIPFDGAGLEQLDLLYISRNLWRHSLESCRLSKVEEERLGIVRRDDVSGALAPMIYFQYLADGDIEPLEGVFLHNELDVLTLSTLASHLGAILSGSVDWPRFVEEDLYRIGVWLTDSELPQLAEEAFEALLARPAEAIARYYAPLAAVYKKQRRYEKAVPLWELAVRRSGSAGHALRAATAQELQPLIELAIYHEHHSKRLDHALRCAEEALGRLERRLALSRGSEKDREAMRELKRRQARLREKLDRKQGARQEQLDLLL